jgi:hypothetical protein
MTIPISVCLLYRWLVVLIVLVPVPVPALVLVLVLVLVVLVLLAIVCPICNNSDSVSEVNLVKSQPTAVSVQ